MIDRYATGSVPYGALPVACGCLIFEFSDINSIITSFGDKVQ